MAPDARTLLDEARTIAVLGAHDEPRRPAFYVPQYLHEQGYRVLPVNPRLAGQRLWGQPVRATLAELDEAADLVDVFRRSDAVMGHLDDLLAMVPRPRGVWLQLGVRSEALARALEPHGIPVVQSRCTLADHQAWRLGPR